MKRFFTMIVAACAFFAASAQNPMVTLSHDGELSFFTNLNAFQSALDSAKNGDILYLSRGEFIINSGSCTISKHVSIVGNGYESHILGNILIKMVDYYDSDAPLFDGVRLDKLSFYNSDTSFAQYLGEVEIRRTWIRTFLSGGYCKELKIDKCFIEEANFNKSSVNSGIMVKNTKMKMASSNTENLFNVVAQNCNISFEQYLPLTAISCILQYTGSDSAPSVYGSSCSIINSLLNFKNEPSGAYIHDCYVYENTDGDAALLDGNLNCSLDLKEFGYLGEDGKTEVGIYGGEDPFSENPSVPTVDTVNSSVEYDAENNKLKVSITVKAD